MQPDLMDHILSELGVSQLQTVTFENGVNGVFTKSVCIYVLCFDFKEAYTQNKNCTCSQVAATKTISMRENKLTCKGILIETSS